ncbi:MULTISPECIES: IDEAL domain-containing protein [Bacillaceae]|uniref:IDEAL domain-containing protein n=1 Tax=Bacillaceae TaxID=186817 RepID=UPI000A2AE1C2|nr:IDEAL domain-containing protein [Bacillus sp. OV166]SMQ86681.1 IDEAL domain-containing protein [Bacillus sp. OV166]
MNNKKQNKSYSEIMKSLHNQKIAQKGNSILNTYIQMIFDEAIITHRLRNLEEGINAALDSKNKLLFLELSTQYIKLKLVE